MKMNLFFSVTITILVTFLFQYYVISFISIGNLNDITNSLGKFYLSSINAVVMGLIELSMQDYFSKMINWNYYFVLLLLLSIVYLLYVFKVGIDDKQYLNEIIEYLSITVQSSNEIENKTSNYKIKKLAHDIISSQSDQIEYMKKLLEYNLNK